MSTKKQLKDLYIEDLGKVTGGGGPISTTAIYFSEEDPNTTHAEGEEDDTTMAIHEEDIYTTHAEGEEDPLPTA